MKGKEDQHFRTDSPTCCKEGLLLTCCIISSDKWSLNSLDANTAFSHGKLIEQTVYVHPPKEAQTNKVWKLRKCVVYRLDDASRQAQRNTRETKLDSRNDKTRNKLLCMRSK